MTKESITQTDLRENLEDFRDGKHLFIGITALIWKNGFNPPDRFNLKLNQFEIERYCLFVVNKMLVPKPKQELKVLIQEQEIKQIKQYPEEDNEVRALMTGLRHYEKLNNN